MRNGATPCPSVRALSHITGYTVEHALQRDRKCHRECHGYCSFMLAVAVPASHTRPDQEVASYNRRSTRNLAEPHWKAYTNRLVCIPDCLRHDRTPSLPLRQRLTAIFSE